MSSPLHAAPSLLLEIAAGEALDVRSFKVDERLSAPFTVELTAMSRNPDLDLEALVGEPARFELVGRRSWVGVLRLLELQRAEPAGLSAYRVELVPALWLLTQRRNHRIFQRMTEPEMACQILSEWNIAFELRIDRTQYSRREYRAQYGESDFAFFSRVLEDSGITYWFESRAESPVLVLSDAAHTNDPRSPILNVDDASAVPPTDFVTGVSVARELKAGRYTMSDVDHRLPPTFPLSSSSLAPGARPVEAMLESFHHVPGAFLYESDAEPGTPAADDKLTVRTSERQAAALVRRRLDAKRGEARTYRFSTNAFDLSPGDRFAILGHPSGDLGETRPLLVTSVRIEGEAAGHWSMACRARASDIPFRPALETPKPKVSGVEIGTVVGPTGEEIHTDEFGRVRVHFRWDRLGQMNEDSSCWVPVSHPWAGTGFGGMNIPRVGQEVVIEFVGGDPDRPIVVGRVYSATQAVPFKLPENKTQSGWKSNSTNGTGGFNEIMFEDLAGHELLRVQAEKDLHRLVKNDEESTVGRDRLRDVKHDESVSVGNNRSVHVGGTERVHIGQNQSVTVGHNRSTQVGVLDVTSVGETHVIMIAPPGEQGPAVSSSITTTDKKIVLDTGAGATITMQGDKITLDAEVIEIFARDFVEIRGKKKGVKLDSPNGGNSFKGKKFSVSVDEVSISGKTVSVVSSGPLDISGAVVNINGPGLPAARSTDAVNTTTILQGAATVFIGGPATAIGPFESAEEAAKAGLAAAKQKALATDDFDFSFEGKIFKDPKTGRYWATDPKFFHLEDAKRDQVETFDVPPDQIEGDYHSINPAKDDAKSDWYDLKKVYR